MAGSTQFHGGAPHVALFPAAGMSHFTSFLRLAAKLSSRGCRITIITPQPTVSAAESDMLSSFFQMYPTISRIEFQILPYRKSHYINTDPFFMQFEAVGKSVHLLRPILSSISPPLSALIADFPILSSVVDLCLDLSIPTYTFILPAARFFSLMAYLPRLFEDSTVIGESIEIPNLGEIPVSSVPPKMLNPNDFFAGAIIQSSPSLCKIKGIFINTFEWFEPEAIRALRSGEILPNMAPLLPIGPLDPFEITNEVSNFPWLDNQSPKSVVYISFGSRTAMSKDQIIELGAGLEKSGCKFLWVLKTTIVDREDKEGVEEILGEAFLERIKGKSLVIKGWVNQNQILGHPAIGGFVSHCGWNSVLETARVGVPILAWPSHGDQMVNTEVGEKIGVAMWCRDWGFWWEKLVDRDEIADKVRKLMVDKNLRERAELTKEEARAALQVNGSSESLLQAAIKSWSNLE